MDSKERRKVMEALITELQRRLDAIKGDFQDHETKGRVEQAYASPTIDEAIGHMTYIFAIPILDAGKKMRLDANIVGRALSTDFAKRLGVSPELLDRLTAIAETRSRQVHAQPDVTVVKVAFPTKES